MAYLLRQCDRALPHHRRLLHVTRPRRDERLLPRINLAPGFREPALRPFHSRRVTCAMRVVTVEQR
jgi:hypothetical protein